MLQRFTLGELLAADLPTLKERLPDMPEKVLKVRCHYNVYTSIVFSPGIVLLCLLWISSLPGGEGTLMWPDTTIP